MPQFLGVVVLYYPDELLKGRIATYVNEVSKLLVIENSESEIPIRHNLKELFPAVEFIFNTSNPGLASALNQALDYGMNHGFDWLLTMDQDSTFDPGAITAMKVAAISEHKAAIVAPITRGSDTQRVRAGLRETKSVITSGSLLNLQVVRECGTFDESLFIDSVDHDYCLKVRRKGYRVLLVNEATLKHQQGNPTKYQFLFWRVEIANHPALRKYYMTRNRLIVAARYMTFDPLFCAGLIFEVSKSILAVVFLERDKTEKIKAILAGFWHFVIRRRGKYTGRAF